MDLERIQANTQEVSDLLVEKLRVRGTSLDVQSRKLGRLVPKRIKQDITYLAHAQQITQNPKLAKMVNEARIQKAHRLVKEHLRDIDPADRRKGALLNALGLIVFNLLLIVIAVIAILRWRGLI